MGPQDIIDQYGQLNLAQVHAALACYHANRGQIEADIHADLPAEREARA